jgi:FKBP-type peptidyl-prolyl cis-trans isomerase SlyD
VRLRAIMTETRNVISFLYTLRGPDGRVIDMSSPEEPIVFLAGSGMIIEGLDAALNLLTAGTKTRIEVPSAQAYGERDPEQVRRVARSFVPIEGEVKVGDQFKTAPDPAAPIVTVIEVDGDELVLDANHSMAGIDLTFDVEVVAMRPATSIEIEHGHVHAAGGSCT